MVLVPRFEMDPVVEAIEKLGSGRLFSHIVGACLIVAGVAFLSGGQDDVLATEHLNAMNRVPVARPKSSAARWLPPPMPVEP